MTVRSDLVAAVRALRADAAARLEDERNPSRADQSAGFFRVLGECRALDAVLSLLGDEEG